MRTQSLVNLPPCRSKQPSNGSRPEPTTHPFLRRREQLPDRKHDTANLDAMMHTRRGDGGKESDRSQHGVCCLGSRAFPKHHRQYMLTVSPSVLCHSKVHHQVQITSQLPWSAFPMPPRVRRERRTHPRRPSEHIGRRIVQLVVAPDKAKATG